MTEGVFDISTRKPITPKATPTDTDVTESEWDELIAFNIANPSNDDE